jgi:hypothetical protein
MEPTAELLRYAINRQEPVRIVDNLNSAIRQMELRAEQLIIQLRAMERDAPGAEQLRSVLLVILVRLVALKRERERLETDLALDCVG